MASHSTIYSKNRYIFLKYERYNSTLLSGPDNISQYIFLVSSFFSVILIVVINLKFDLTIVLS